MTSSIARRGETALAKSGYDFNDHSSFHGTVGRAVLGGAAGAFLTELITTVLGVADSGALFTLLAGIGVMSAVSFHRKKWWRTVLGGVLGLFGGLAYVATAPYWPLFGAALLGLAAAPVLALGESKARMAVTAAVAGAFGLGGIHVAHWMQSVGLLSGVIPDPLATAAAGGALGLFFGLASAPKHLARAGDPVEQALLDALHVKDGELHEILARTLSIHQSVRADLAQRKDEATVTRLGERVSELTLRILKIAEQCRNIERDLAAAPQFELEERINALKRKAESASDQSARETYLSAVASLDGQLKAFTAIHRGRERVVARLHANVALLEKVRFSLLHLKSADAERFGGEASPILEALEELSREIDATSTAVGEVYGKSEGRELTGDGKVYALVQKPKKELAALPETSEDLQPEPAAPPAVLDPSDDLEPPTIGIADHRRRG